MQTKRIPSFDAMIEKLPHRVHELFQTQEGRIRADWRDPLLHLKKLHGKVETYSIRITSEYRAMFVRDGDVLWFFAVGHRKDIYR
jgi:mRNA-degrading endonuclease RelE of RelBE toxin-antitoxin system